MIDRQNPLLKEKQIEEIKRDIRFLDGALQNARERLRMLQSEHLTTSPKVSKKSEIREWVLGKLADEDWGGAYADCLRSAVR